MHLWASAEHSLKYKYFRNIPEPIKERLLKVAEVAANLDEEMTKIKEVIEAIEVENSRGEEYSLDDLEIFLGNMKKW